MFPLAGSCKRICQQLWAIFPLRECRSLRGGGGSGGGASDLDGKWEVCMEEAHQGALEIPGSGEWEVGWKEARFWASPLGHGATMEIINHLLELKLPELCGRERPRRQ